MELTKAQTTWHAEFRERVADVESAYHYWQNAEDRRRANTKAEEDRDLSHRATVKQNKHSDALRWLTEWVQARPYPATDQTADTQAPTVRPYCTVCGFTGGFHHPNCAQADNPAPTPAPVPTQTDCRRVTSTLTDASDETHMHLTGWNDAMEAIDDVRSTSADPNLWANRVQINARRQTDDPYARGTVDAMTHFLDTGLTTRRAP